MCFVNDNYDWSAEVVEEDERIAETVIRCGECNAEIQIGESYHFIHQQESEECLSCRNSECDCVDWEDDNADLNHECKCSAPDYGNNYDQNTCLECRKFLAAIKRHELDEGCREWESQPMLGEMVETLQEFDDVSGYLAKAEEMFPELVASGYLGRMRERICRE